MNKLLAAVLAALNLPEKATEPEGLAALQTYVAKAKADGEQVAALTTKLTATEKNVATLTEKVTEAEKKGAALNASNTGNPDPANFVPISAVKEMQQQLAALSATVQGGEVDKVISAALSAGKLLPSLEKWARDLGAKDMAALNSFLATTPAIAALTANQTGGAGPAGGQTGAHSTALTSISAQFGNDAAAVAKIIAEMQQ